ncbi:MAG: ABC transporter permease [Betaproteobacteria bacterium]|nr:ABC transporter permease [Betaproteobacteria bacterium]NBT11281.1 ABC transporter permease [Betaproteobacteria bacterium]NBU50143.1 ABC transporter permease [Betaproteobacteria bacterium]
MRSLLTIAWASAWHRRFALSLVVLSLALSTFLLLMVERVRHDVRENFSNAVSGTDLIVGARGSAVQLLLYSVFRIGQPTQTMEHRSVLALQQDPAVRWVVPISLGDTHRGYPVVATTTAYFDHVRYGPRLEMSMREGRRFEAVFDAVLGADVAQQLGYRLGQRLVLRHGSGALDSADHDEMPFTVVGILARTGTPVDRSVHIRLEGMQALHIDWIAGMPLPGAKRTRSEDVPGMDLTPRTVTAALVGLKSRAAVFAMQRRVNAFEAEPLMAVLPGVTLDELWGTVAQAERALSLMSVLVGLVSLAGLMAVVMTALEQRRRELAVLRSVGAGPRRVFGLLLMEGLLVSLSGAAVGVLAWALVLWAGSPWVQAEYGIILRVGAPTAREALLAAAVVLAGLLASLWPGWRAYRLSLADGLAPRGA